MLSHTPHTQRHTQDTGFPAVLSDTKDAFTHPCVMDLLFKNLIKFELRLTTVHSVSSTLCKRHEHN